MMDMFAASKLVYKKLYLKYDTKVSQQTTFLQSRKESLFTIRVFCEWIFVSRLGRFFSKQS